MHTTRHTVMSRGRNVVRHSFIRLPAVSSILVLLAICGAHNADADATDAQKCAATLMQAYGKYAACRYKAEGQLFKTNDRTKRDAAAAKCLSKVFRASDKAYEKYGDACPDNDEQPSAMASLHELLKELFVPNAWAQLLSGNKTTTAFAVDSADTSLIDTAVSLAPSTYTLDPTIPVGGQQWIAGVDKLTVIDTEAQLEWEQKTEDPGLHDVTDTYAVADAANWIVQLNSANFAGHNDWRLPTEGELGGLRREPCDAYGFPCVPTLLKPTSAGTDPLAVYLSSTVSANPADGVLAVTYASVDSTPVAATAGYVRAVRTRPTPTSTTTTTMPCKVVGVSCSTQGECCSGICDTTPGVNTCSCLPEVVLCTSNSQCCSNHCSGVCVP
jgi:hypothetical protein